MLLYITLVLEMPDMPEAVTVVTGVVAAWLIFRTLLLLIEPRRHRARRLSRRFYVYDPAK